MTVRPTDYWRGFVAKEKREVVSGELAPEDAVWIRAFPESLLSLTDEAFSAFESELWTLSDPSDEQVLGAVKRVVLALNVINDAHSRMAWDTGERDELCQYIEKSLVEAGIDLQALAARRGLAPHEITDEWRRW